MNNPNLKKSLIVFLLGVVLSIGVYQYVSIQVRTELKANFENQAQNEIKFFNYILKKEISSILSSLHLSQGMSSIEEYQQIFNGLQQNFPEIQKLYLIRPEKTLSLPSKLTVVEQELFQKGEHTAFSQPYIGLILKLPLPKNIETSDSIQLFGFFDLKIWFHNNNQAINPSVSLELLDQGNASLLIHNSPDLNPKNTDFMALANFGNTGLNLSLRPTRLFFEKNRSFIPEILLGFLWILSFLVSWRYFEKISKRKLQDWDYQDNLFLAQTRLRENYKANFSQEEDILCCLDEILNSPHWDLAFAIPVLKTTSYEFAPILGKIPTELGQEIRKTFELSMLELDSEGTYSLKNNINLGGNWPSLLATRIEAHSDTSWILITLGKFPFKRHMSQITFVVQLGLQLGNFWDFRITRIAQETSEAHSKAIVETSILAIITINDKGAIQSFNPAATQMFGYSLEEVIGKNINMLMPSPYHNEHDGYLHNYLSTGTKKIIGSGREVIGLKKSGETFPLDLAVSEMKIGDKRQFLGLITDISDRKKVEEQLKVAVDKANEANLAKSAFLANMSHEIRTPMNSVLGMTELLGETELNLSQRNYISALRASGENLLDIINAILDLSKIEAGEFKVDQADFSLRELIESSVQIISFRAESKDLTLLYRIDPSAPTNLVGDLPRVRQVIINLLSNAIKFAERGEITLEVALMENTGPQVKLQFKVTDHGIGIPEGKLDTIFQSFTQADSTTTRKFGGTGLGLSISKKLVELMDGKIFVESIEGEGSQFYALLPFGIAEQPLPYSQINIENLKEKKVLLIARSAQARDFRKEQLTSWGMSVEAIECPVKWKESQKPETDLSFDYLILEMDLPHQEAIDLFSLELKSARPTGQRIIIGLHSLKSEFGESQTFWDEWLEKPVLYHELAKLLNQTREIAVKKEKVSKKNLTPAKILMAEDNEDNVVLIGLFFKKTPYELITAANGKVALDLFKETQFDLVLMDMEMPVMDGLTATREIRRFEQETGKPRTPILALTAHAMASHHRESFDAGCDSHLTKPIKKTTLIKTVEEFLNPSLKDHE
ncbi:MAG: PAS domain S-box protein [SAR324 cluster bacterium]|nr:PAS domain S-box protein [SAR324 cluster bacterium]